MEHLIHPTPIELRDAFDLEAEEQGERVNVGGVPAGGEDLVVGGQVAYQLSEKAMSGDHSLV